MVTIIESASENYAEIARRPLEADQCALIVVDIQEKLLPPIFQKEQLVRNSKLLIRAAGVLKIPAIMSTQYAKGLGKTVPEVASLLPEAEAIDKDQFSCFGSDTFCGQVKRLPGKRNTLLLCGMESHICVMQTALAGLREGYLVHVASDAVGSRTEWTRVQGDVAASEGVITGWRLVCRCGRASFVSIVPLMFSSVNADEHTEQCR